jgi:hypothetical protein
MKLSASHWIVSGPPASAMLSSLAPKRLAISSFADSYIVVPVDHRGRRITSTLTLCC